MSDSRPPRAYQTRKITFSASHRLHSPYLNNAENAQVYGKCNHINGHGHNYIVKVTLFGEIDPKTGMIMNMTELKQFMEEAVMKQLDHKNLDKDVEFFQTRASTTENVTLFIWERMKAVMSRPELLHEVVVYETENNIVKYKGE
ncbi:6-pyruvoyl tetrahydrobiopterin synthase [Tribolium madens]|uniref:6-pyruvoyl tetrahydrobiopterin synthase n=1 Tax=Tribolium madens TaxID=41895 RepID=UPI001CF74B47|nr:6-pyruvoyl tetrahydrobiopterin synthase [Tribolium madens]